MGVLGLVVAPEFDFVVLAARCNRQGAAGRKLTEHRLSDTKLIALTRL